MPKERFSTSYYLQSYRSCRISAGTACSALQHYMYVQSFVSRDSISAEVRANRSVGSQKRIVILHFILSMQMWKVWENARETKNKREKKTHTVMQRLNGLVRLRDEEFKWPVQITNAEAVLWLFLQRYLCCCYDFSKGYFWGLEIAQIWLPSTNVHVCVCACARVCVNEWLVPRLSVMVPFCVYV